MKLGEERRTPGLLGGANYGKIGSLCYKPTFLINLEVDIDVNMIKINRPTTIDLYPLTQIKIRVLMSIIINFRKNMMHF